MKLISFPLLVYGSNAKVCFSLLTYGLIVNSEQQWQLNHLNYWATVNFWLNGVYILLLRRTSKIDSNLTLSYDLMTCVCLCLG